MRACPPYEMEHLSEEFTNGSSADATGNRQRFQAENLRQITIYQLMKPLKITPPTPTEPQSFCAHCPRHCITYASTGCTPRSGSGMTHTLHYSCSYSSIRQWQKKEDIFGQCLPLILNNTHSRNSTQTRRGSKSFFFCFLQSTKKRDLIDMRLPSVECTWASVMRNQQSV